MEAVLFFLLGGILFLFIEIYLTPGTTIFGAIGLVLIIIGNVQAATVFTEPWNYIVIIGSVLITLFFLYLFFKLISSKKLSVQAEITSKVNEISTNLQLGDRGKTLTVLRPNGRAIFGEEIIEVFSTGNYVDDDEDIEIIKITSDKLFVKPIEN